MNRQSSIFLILALLIAMLFGGYHFLVAHQPASTRSPEPVSQPPVIPEPVQESAPEPQDTETEPEAALSPEAIFESARQAADSRNRELAQLRERLLRIRLDWQRTLHISKVDFLWLKALAKEVALDPAERDDAAFFAALTERVNTVPDLYLLAHLKVYLADLPPELLAANNPFRLRCYEPGCGIKPANNPQSLFEYRRFASIQEATEAFIHLVNTDPAYLPFRSLRARTSPEDLLNLIQQHHVPDVDIDAFEAALTSLKPPPEPLYVPEQ